MLVDIQRDFHEDSNFWEMYPDLKVAGPSGKIYKADKSRNKANSSKVMWCIALCFDRGSKFFNLPEYGEENKITMLFGDYLGKPNWRNDNKAKFEELKEWWLLAQVSKLERALIDAEDKMEERRILIKETPYTMGKLDKDSGKWIGNTIDILDKAQATTDKIMANIEKVKNLVIQEQAQAKEGKQKGGGESSLSDQEVI
tara:strand:- start:581 stop:1177 length:597 start_codon:yes stop_codon:yes gene_type:complete